jgi:hypothetical protein
MGAEENNVKTSVTANSVRFYAPEDLDKAQ